MSGAISFDTERASRYVSDVLASFLGDPADSDFQRGYLSGMLTLYREGLGKGAGDDRLALLDAQVRTVSPRSTDDGGGTNG